MGLGALASLAKIRICSQVTFRQQFKSVPSVFSDFFLNVSVTHDRPTLASRQLELRIPQTNSVTHGSNSTKTQAAKNWNTFIPLLLKKENEKKKENENYRPKHLHEFSSTKFSKKISEILLNQPA